jgi:hypothetical protein
MGGTLTSDGPIISEEDFKKHFKLNSEDLLDDLKGETQIIRDLMKDIEKSRFLCESMKTSSESDLLLTSKTETPMKRYHSLPGTSSESYNLDEIIQKAKKCKKLIANRGIIFSYPLSFLLFVLNHQFHWK